jgi:hypothetical protein
VYSAKKRRSLPPLSGDRQEKGYPAVKQAVRGAGPTEAAQRIPPWERCGAWVRQGRSSAAMDRDRERRARAPALPPDSLRGVSWGGDATQVRDSQRPRNGARPARG